MEEYDDNIRAVCSPEVQVRKPTFLESGLLCKYGRRQQASRAEVYTKSRKRGYDFSPNEHGGVLRPVQGVAGIIYQKETEQEK